MIAPGAGGNGRFNAVLSDRHRMMCAGPMTSTILEVRTNTLSGGSVYEHFFNVWISKPELFNLNPIQ